MLTERSIPIVPPDSVPYPDPIPASASSATAGEHGRETRVEVARFPLQGLVETVLAQHGTTGWRMRVDGFWCRVSPPDARKRVQGWKLHLSATPLAAPEVLFRAAQVLVRHGCSFKFAATPSHVLDLNSARFDRSQSGKFITVYPRDDEQFRMLAAELDRVTADLPGPAILSDRPYRKGGIVFFRYGVFSGVRHMTNDSEWQVRLRAPDGSLVEDTRRPWFCPPAWAGLPFPSEPAASPARPPARTAASDVRAVLLRERYLVTEVLQHSARGGVFKAQDRHTGVDVIIKQARAHTAERYTGEDARSLLRQEAAVLAELHGLCPEVIEVFDHEGHTFLVESHLPGRSLAQWVFQRGMDAGGTALVPLAEAVPLALRLTDLLDSVHRRALVLRDFSPNNIMVLPDGELRLIDPEFAVTAGRWGYLSHTPGFGAPEYVAGPQYAPAPAPETDLFSLGAVLFYVVTGTNPAFAPDGGPAARTPAERLDLVLRVQAEQAEETERNESVGALRPVILGLCAQEPTQRWSLARVRDFLTGPAANGPATTGPATTGPAAASPPAAFLTAARPTTAELADPNGPIVRRLIVDGIARIVSTVSTDDDAERLWPSGVFGERTDPCNVQHGAAGVLAVLTAAARSADELGVDADELRGTVARVARWLDVRRESAPVLLPGLFFGRAGTAWALFDAARFLGDDGLAARALDLTRALPVRWPNPDVFHGAAGAGMLNLHLWRATGQAEFLDRVGECADGLLAAAESTTGADAHDAGISDETVARGLLWPIPRDFDSALAGLRHLGYAHGVAGVGTFLVAAAVDTGRGDLLDVAARAGTTLMATAEYGPWGARWRSDLADPPGSGMGYHMCSGSSGVGTFLVRLWRETGDPAVLELAEAAASAVHRSRWAGGSTQCHGLSGNGEFLLDMDDAVGGGPYRQWAGELAACLYTRHAIHDRQLIVPDESGTGTIVDYGVGLSGVVGFLLRMRLGGPRMFVPGTD